MPKVSDITWASLSETRNNRDIIAVSASERRTYVPKVSAIWLTPSAHSNESRLQQSLPAIAALISSISHNMRVLRNRAPPQLRALPPDSNGKSLFWLLENNDFNLSNWLTTSMQGALSIAKHA